FRAGPRGRRLEIDDVPQPREAAIGVQATSRLNGLPSEANSPRPMAATASTIRPLRARSLSATATRRGLGVAVAEAARKRFAIEVSSRLGASAQAAMK